MRGIAAILIGALLLGCSPASKGTMPPPGPNGVIDPSTVPDFVAVAGDLGVVGYARRDHVLGSSDAPFPVYGDDLRTVVGTMVPGRGFIPNGVDPQSVPTFDVVVAPASKPGPPTGRVTLYVRNDAIEIVWVAIDGQAMGATGFLAENMGVGCLTMAAGSSLVVMDRSPADFGAHVVAVLYHRGQEVAPTPMWVVIGKERQLSQGTGVPPWWGEPQSC